MNLFPTPGAEPWHHCLGVGTLALREDITQLRLAPGRSPGMVGTRGVGMARKAFQQEAPPSHPALGSKEGVGVEAGSHSATHLAVSCVPGKPSWMC